MRPLKRRSSSASAGSGSTEGTMITSPRPERLIYANSVHISMGRAFDTWNARAAVSASLLLHRRLGGGAAGQAEALEFLEELLRLAVAHLGMGLVVPELL